MCPTDIRNPVPGSSRFSILQRLGRIPSSPEQPLEVADTRDEVADIRTANENDKRWWKIVLEKFKENAKAPLPSPHLYDQGLKNII